MSGYSGGNLGGSLPPGAAFLQKPFSGDDVADAIRCALRVIASEKRRGPRQGLLFVRVAVLHRRERRESFPARQVARSAWIEPLDHLVDALRLALRERRHLADRRGGPPKARAVNLG